MHISGMKSEESSKSLHEKRWEDMIQKNNKIRHDEIVKSVEGFGNKPSIDKKDTYFKSLVYYNPQDCLSHCMKDHKEKAKANIEKLKAAKEANGQKLTTKSDLKNVVGEFHEGSKKFPVDLTSSVVLRTFIREWCGTICIFDMCESNYGRGKMKRRGYEIIKVWAVYYRKNGVGLSKEIILQERFTYKPEIAKDAAEPKRKDS